MMKPTKNLKRITYADGRTDIIKRISSGYQWGNRTSSHYDSVEYGVAELGGVIDIIPNPQYVEQLAEYNRRRTAKANPFTRLFR